MNFISINYMQADEYNINKYTDNELYKILNLNSDVSDRVLEGQIMIFTRRYKNMQTPAGDQLAKFFIDMHAHFFNEEEEEEVAEVEESMKNKEENIGEGFETMLELKKKKGEEGDKSETVLIQGMGKGDDDKYLNSDGEKTDDQVVLTKEVVSSKGVVNPLIQQTIQRVVSIDSQYREDKSKLATDYSFLLSEPLRDVVSLSLYSVQIPYTWYTVNSNFGSNFFLLRGDVPGINGGDFDYKMEIVPGNYTAENLIIALNDAFTKAVSVSPDVDFGDTNLSYNVNNQVTTIDLFIAKHYDETSYYLEFMNWETSLFPVTKPRNNSIAAFLGFQKSKYYFNELESRRRVNASGQSYLLPNTVTGNNTGDQSERTYYLSEEANNITVIRYTPSPYGDGTEEYKFDTNAEQDLSFNIKFDLSTNKLYTRTELETEFNNQLSTNIYLQNSSISRENITLGESLGNGQSIYNLKLYFDRNTTNNKSRTKTVLMWADEANPPQGNKIWTGPTSCFRYDASLNELNNLVTEYQTMPQTSDRYPVTSSPYLELRCIKQYFDISQNNYQFTIINTDPTGVLNNANGYLLNEYISAINSAIVTTNNNTIHVDKNPFGDINTTNTVSNLTSNSRFNIKIDLTKTFNSGDFMVDISDSSILKSVMNFDNSYNDLFYTPVNKSDFQINATYSLFEDLLMTIKPHPDNNGNQNMPETEIRILPCTVNEITYTAIPGRGIVFNTIDEMATVINTAINRTTDYENVSILQGSGISITDKNNELMEATLTMNINKSLTESDFNIIAKDPDFYIDPPVGGVTDVSNIEMSWIKNLVFNDESVIEPGYNLSAHVSSNNSYAELLMGETIVQNLIFITDVNNKFYLKPYVFGVTDPYNMNDLEFSLPIGTYNRNELIEQLNTAFRNNVLTQNSRITIKDGPLGLTFYTQFRIEVKKSYTAADYKIVFYDPTSFAACYPGVQSVRTATFDNTLGWTMGFREYTIYYIRSLTSANGLYTLSGNTTVSTDLYNYLLITLDDFNQNRLNDGLVTIANKEKDISMPAYANKSKYKCDPETGKYIYDTQTNDAGNKLTQAQLYTITEIANSKTKDESINYGTGPFAKDVFGLIPIKTAALNNGNVYVEFGGTLQNQQRKYFGPVNISRMAVSLLSDKGDVMNLNGSNWSFSLIVEQLYQS
jgi:hypothetical protein